jgi:hypothetical protein
VETLIRRSYQGVINIIRFNWHLYVMAALFVIALFTIAILFEKTMFWLCNLLAIAVFASTVISLFVSYLVYDRSDLYDFHWLRLFNQSETLSIVNIHAGFDETSLNLKKHFPMASLQVFDFYNSEKHTEISIERARKAYPPFKGTIKITTSRLPVAIGSVNIIFNIFALHEVRDRNERIQFLEEQVTALANDGKIVVVEHLRDMINFSAYNIGFFHFLPEKEWLGNFRQAGLVIENRFRVTPFITVFILKKVNGNTP